MSGILCVWAADLPDSSEQWYEDKHIPETMSRHSETALLTKSIPTPLDNDLESVGTKDAAWKNMTVYEIKDVQKIVDTTHDPSNDPVMDGSLKGSRFETRLYEVYKSWQADEEWNGDYLDVSSLIFFEWQPREGFENEVLEFYEREMVPMFMAAPEALRLRWFKIRNATALKGDSCTTLKNEDLYRYMSLVEMTCEEWPWDEIFAINGMPQWNEYFEDQKAVMWQGSHYVVQRSYPDQEVDDNRDA